jgi:hypothetical protein
MKNTLACLVLAACAAPALPAQDRPEPNSTYKVDFVIRDGSDAAAKSGRRYTILIGAQGKGAFRVGQRVPYAAGSYQPAAAGAPVVATQWQYADIGVNIDCRIRELNNSGTLDLSADIDISNVVQHDKGPGQNPPNPTIANTHIRVETFVAPGARVQAASIDDPVTGRKFDVEATVTKQM